MKKIDIGQTISILANIGVIAGIVFLGFELHQNNVTTRVVAVDNYIQSAQVLNDTLIRDRELAGLIRTVSNGGEVADVDQFRLNLLHGNTIRLWHRAYYLRQEGLLDDPFWRIQLDEIRGIVNGDEHMRGYWERNKLRYDNEVNSIIEGLIGASSVE